MECKYCLSENVHKDGLDRKRNQRYECNNCGKRFIHNPNCTRLTEIDKNLIIRSKAEGVSFRGIGRLLNGQHWMTAYYFFKKSQHLNESTHPTSST